MPSGWLRELGVDSANVAGYSMGGAIAQELAIEFPQVLGRLALMATYDAGDPRGSSLFRGFAALRRSLPHEEYMRLTLPWSYTYKEYQVEGFIEQIISDGVDDPLYQESEAYERQMEATIAFNSRDRLHRISCPTLVLCGEDDVMTPMRFGRSLTERIEGSRLVTIGGTGHAFPPHPRGGDGRPARRLLQRGLGGSPLIMQPRTARFVHALRQAQDERQEGPAHSKPSSLARSW